MNFPAMPAVTLPLEGRAHVMAAVSGGSDSTALLIIAWQQAQQMQRPPRLSAITIDHGLRAGSADEARAVGALAARLGIGHRIARWEGEKPATGLQAAARDARRKLLAAAAAEAGADLVLTGHTLDDQRETVFMRARRGSGPGLAGIAPAALAFNDAGAGEAVRICRPLLSVRRADLRGHLARCGVGWIDDPSNSNGEFERVAARGALAQMREPDLAELDRLESSSARLRIAANERAAQLIRAHVCEAAPGLVHVAPAFFDADDREAVAVALGCVIAFAGGRSGMVERGQCEALAAAARERGFATGAAPKRASLGGAVADMRAAGVFLMQEQRRGAPRLLPFAGRYRALAAGHAAMSNAPRTHPAPASLVRRALTGEPVFADGEGRALPAAQAWAQGHAIRRLLNPWPDLVPGFDIRLAQALAEVAGFAPLPDI